MVYNYYEESRIKNDKLPVRWQEHNVQNELLDFLQMNWQNRESFYNDNNTISKQQFLSFLPKGEIRTNNYIGTIAFNNEQINIFPKVFREDLYDLDVDTLDVSHLLNNICKWLSYCTRVNYPYVNINSYIDEASNLRELFETIFLHYVKMEVDKRPYYRYEEITEDIGCIKGKVNIKDYCINKYAKGNIDKFSCTFSDFVFDNEVNRIIKYTTQLIALNTNKSNKKLSRLILSKLNNVKEVVCYPSDCENQKLSKLNRNYSIIINMCKMFLINKETTFLMKDTESYCFLFPTEVLFEGFVSGFIQSILEDRANVKLQASDRTVFSDVIYKNASLGKSIKMRHDILVEDPNAGIFIFDTKYKMVERFEGNSNEIVKNIVDNEIESSDIYQAIVYASTRGINDVYLLYPLFRFEDDEIENPYGINKQYENNKINVHLVRIPFVFELDENSVVERLKRIITNLIYK